MRIPFFSDMLSLLYPQLCVGCGKDLYFHERALCSICKAHLPKTYYHSFPQNPITELFQGRLPLEHATAGYYFNKGALMQSVLHQLKYKKRPDIGVELGKHYGYVLRQAKAYKTIDVVVPVPLHPKKQRMRGYNQSEKIAEGLAQSLHCKLVTNALVRNTFTDSQTRKNKEERWQNVQGKFSLKTPEAIAGKHVLLVDDVITTGATLEACAHALLQASIKLSIACLAIAE